MGVPARRLTGRRRCDRDPQLPGISTSTPRENAVTQATRGSAHDLERAVRGRCSVLNDPFMDDACPRRACREACRTWIQCHAEPPAWRISERGECDSNLDPARPCFGARSRVARRARPTADPGRDSEDHRDSAAPASIRRTGDVAARIGHSTIPPGSPQAGAKRACPPATSPPPQRAEIDVGWPIGPPEDDAHPCRSAPCRGSRISRRDRTQPRPRPA